MPEERVARMPEYSKAFPQLAPLLDVWFNPDLGTEWGKEPLTTPEMLRIMLWNQVGEILGTPPPEVRPKDIIRRARLLICQVLDRALEETPHSPYRHHWLAARQAVRGNPIAANYLLRGGNLRAQL